MGTRISVSIVRVRGSSAVAECATLPSNAFPANSRTVIFAGISSFTLGATFCGIERSTRTVSVADSLNDGVPVPAVTRTMNV